MELSEKEAPLTTRDEKKGKVTKRGSTATADGSHRLGGGGVKKGADTSGLKGGKKVLTTIEKA